MRARSLFIAVALPAAAALAGTCYVVQPIAGGRAMSTAPAVSPERLQAHVRALSEEFVPRDYAHPQNLNRAAAYIRDELERAGGRVLVQNFGVRGVTYRNVVASFGPEEGERIVVGAHYDAAGPYPAADDNASGVAGLLELARLLSAESLRMAMVVQGIHAAVLRLA